MKNLLRHKFVMVIAFVLLAACSATGGELSIKDVWARPTAAQASSTPTAAMAMGDAMTSTDQMSGMGSGPISAVYMAIENNTGNAEKLVSLSTSVADMAQVHETTQTSDGMTSMQEVQGGLDIPAGSTVTLKPGGYHIMLMGLHQDLSVGQSFSLTLTFQSGKQITVDVPVKQQ
jgi:copper(I)-binding protein